MTETRAQNPQFGSTIALFMIAAAVTALHLATNGRYGFHRDELQFLSDARQLDWGFVPYPPFTAAIQHLGLAVFGTSLVGLRLASDLFQAAAIVIAGLMARELGGGRLAQITAALAVAFSPLPIFEGTEFQYSSFDYVWWMLAAYFVIRLLKSENPRWWLAIGASLGMGMMTKYSISFFIAGILGAMLLTRARRYYLSLWFWAGVGIAFLIFLPNLLWLVHHDFISYRFLQHIHARDVRQGRADGFLRDQFMICVNLAATPLWIVGLIVLLRSPRYRMLAWMYLIPLALYFFAKGRGYYLAAAYPMLLAMGSVSAESWLQTLRPLPRRTIETVYFVAFAGCTAFICAALIPLATSGPLRDFALKQSGDLREEFGWQQMVATIAQVRDSLPADQRANLGIVVGNYGERGAVDLYGPAYHLPAAISGTNSGWLHSYPKNEPKTLIILGVGDRDREAQFTSCKLATKIPYPSDQHNEESNDDREIYVCGPPRLSWPELWKIALDFG